MGANQQKQLWLFSGLLWLFGAASPAMAAPFYGVSKAIDGDSLMVGDKEVRLFGIDAPEFNQVCKRSGQDWACGSEAADRLSQLVTGKNVRCTQVGTDQHGRTLARCSVGPTDINRTMVATGYAVAFRRYSTNYVSAEESAKLSKRGIWAGTFEMPQQYRNEPDPIPAPVARTSGELPVVVNARRATSGGVGRGCNIKGNHSRRGEKIYHLPGRPYYNETVAEEMFCTEAQARAAGYRRSRAQ